MASFSATDAAFAGFRLMRERPKVILAWALFFFAVSLLYSILIIATGAGEAVVALQTLQASGGADPEQTLQAMSALGPLAVLLPALSLVIYSIVFAASNRAFLRPHDGAFGAFHLGPDELRVAGLLVLMFLVWLAYSMVVLFLAALLFAAGKAIGPPLSFVIDLIGILGVVAALAFPWVRLSLALPMTLDRRRLVLFDSWTLSRGHFWRLLGAYLLTAVLLIVVFLLCMMIMAGIFAAVAMVSGGSLADFNPDLSSFSGYFNPLVLFGVVLQAFMSAALLAIWAGPPAEAYRALTRTGAASI